MVHKSICQPASPGFFRLRQDKALRLSAIKPSVCERSAMRFAQDDGFSGAHGATKRCQAMGSLALLFSGFIVLPD